MKAIISGTFLLVIGQVGVASAQYAWGGNYYHASTAEEGIQRGFADVLRSAGAANLMNSRAAINYQDAAKKYIDNRMHATNTYFQMRSLNRQAREAERGPRPTQEDVIRYAQQRAPKRLGQSELDPLTGEIAWPLALTTDEFKKDRERLEQIYGQRARTRHLSADDVMEITKIIKNMEAALKAKLQAEQVRPQDYTTAKSFINSLSAESYYRPG